MANIVSIDWSVEEFRRLIDEKPHSGSTDSPLDTIRVLNFEVRPPSGPPDYGPTIENTDSPGVEVASEGLLSLRPTEVVATEKDTAPGWTAAEVIATAAVQGEQGEQLTSSREASVETLDAALHIRDVEVARPLQTTVQLLTDECARPSEIETATPGVRTEEVTASGAPIEPDASGEQPHSGSTGSPLDKTIRVLNFEIGPPSEPTDHGPTMENVDSPEAEIADEGLLSLRPTEVVATEKDTASGRTVAEVIAAAAAQGEQGEEPTSSRAATVETLDTAPHIRDVEVAQPLRATDQLLTNESARSSEFETTAPGIRIQKAGTASAASIEPVATRALGAPNRSMINPLAPSVFAGGSRIDPRSALEKAIAEPDIYTRRADRDRAIELRWILRDIRGNRLKWSPPREHDLKVLIEFDFVEMRDGVPQLTNAGVSAII
jgi:VIT1/CCC1 family predicted Fe2+/Mn2+ transporter